MTKKKDLSVKLLSKVEPRWPAPEPLEGADLLEQGLYAVLLRRLEPKAAARGVEALRKAYADWNEVRVAQAQEIAKVLRAGGQGVLAAGDVRAYLQEVFQRSHGLELEFLRDDPEAVKRFVATLPFLGMGTTHFLMWLASDGELPITSALTRVLDRMGLIPRMSNPKKVRAAIAPHVAKGKELEFAIKIGEVASRWCDANKPLCHQCVVVDDCKYGKKAYREWRTQQDRMEAQRVREEARLAALRKKEEARRVREEARARKHAEAEAAKRAREAERKAKSLARKREAEEQRLAAQRLRLEAKRKRDAERARKQAEAEKARKARQAAAAKKEAARKAEAGRKAKAEAARKAKAEAAKKAAAQKAAKAAKKAKKATKKKAARKPAARKPAARKPAAQKRPERKATERKAPERKVLVRRGRARKA